MKMMMLVESALNQMNHVMQGHRENKNAKQTFYLENQINDLRNQLKADLIADNSKREYSYLVGTQYIEFISEKLGDYIVNVVQARLGN